MGIKRKAFLFVDGDNSKIVINPGKSEKEKFELRVKAFKKHKSLIFRKTKQKAQTKGGKKVLVCANASTEDDFKEAIKNGCDGIGLFRIESLYLEHKTAPSHEYLAKRMKRILKNAPDQRIVIRLLDIGGDKQLPYIDVEEERNPFLGLRGVRLLLKHKKILKTQIQVVLDLLSQFSVELLVPMVSVPREMNAVKEVVREIENECGANAKLRVGAMIETPAAVANIEEIAETADFLSIGTNDLIQYSMAIGRENMSMVEYYDEGVQTIMKWIKEIVQSAEKHSIPCCVCGEIAGDEQYMEPLLKAGITELSVTPSRIPFIKEKIRSIE